MEKEKQGEAGSLNSAAELAQCYAEELVRYRCLMDTAHKLRAQIMAEDLDGVASTLASQARLMEEIDALEAEVAPLKQEVCRRYGLSQFSVPALKRIRRDQEVARLAAVAGELLELLRHLTRLEEDNRALLEEKMTRLAAEAEQLQKGAKATEAYLKPPLPAPEPRFIDRKE
ncbi:MAG: hypothetical protein QJR13_02715 [Bacillota bacterium]|nr:hypothetical protein [Bacillota bacterium]